MTPEGPETEAEDRDTDLLVERFKGGDREAFGTIYTRYFDRVYRYMRVALKDSYEAEDAAQQVFAKALEAMPRYERRRQPFRAWLFTIARNVVIDAIALASRTEPMDPAEINGRIERDAASAQEDEELRSLGWITDSDLNVFIERLPLAQRQVLVLRYLLDLSAADTARVLDRTRTDVSTLHHRALQFLEARLRAIGRAPERSERAAPMRAWGTPANVIRARRFALWGD